MLKPCKANKIMLFVALCIGVDLYAQSSYHVDLKALIELEEKVVLGINESIDLICRSIKNDVESNAADPVSHGVVLSFNIQELNNYKKDVVSINFNTLFGIAQNNPSLYFTEMIREKIEAPLVSTYILKFKGSLPYVGSLVKKNNKDIEEFSLCFSDKEIYEQVFTEIKHIYDLFKLQMMAHEKFVDKYSEEKYENDFLPLRDELYQRLVIERKINK